MEFQVSLDFLASLVPVAFQAVQEALVKLDCQVFLEQMDAQEMLVHRELSDSQALQELQETLVFLARTEHPGVKECLEVKVRQEPMASLEVREHQAFLAPLDSRVTQVHKDCQAYKDLKDHRDFQVSMVLQDKTELKEVLVSEARQVFQDRMGLLEYLVL